MKDRKRRYIKQFTVRSDEAREMGRNMTKTEVKQSEEIIGKLYVKDRRCTERDRE